MEKQITFTEIRAVFTKDFDTFGKMDPFLEFSIGKEKAKTEIIADGGKQPKWKETIVLKFYEDQSTIILNAYQQDTASNDYMGQGKIDVKPLKDGGDIEVKIMQQDGVESGVVFCKYALKTLAPVPILVVKNIKCDFYKDTEFILKTKPFFIVTTNSQSAATEVKDKGDARQLAWGQTLKVKIAENQRISFNLEDKADKNNKIFSYDAFPKEFKTVSGLKKFNVIDANFEPLGVLSFNYETLNFVSKEDSAKNQSAAIKQNNELTQLKIESIKGNLNAPANDLYFKLAVGPNLTKTSVIQKAAKDFTMQVKKTIYAEKYENKLVIAAYNEQNIGGDTLYGSGQLLLDSLVEGNNTVKLANRRNIHFGDIIVNLSNKTVINRELTLTDMKVKLGVSADIIGDSDVYLVAKIGGWSCRSETQSGKDITYAKSLTLKYSDQKQLTIQLMDEDITKDDQMYSVEANLQDFKDEGQMTFPLVPEKYKDDKTKHGTLSFKYKNKNSVAKQKPKEEPVKKEEPKKQQIKKQQKLASQKKIKAVEPEKQKKEEPKKQQVAKKEEPKKEQKKVQQKKPLVNTTKLEESILKQKTLEKSRQTDKEKLEKSRNTIRLPDINDPKNWGDKIFEKQSSSTLQKSIHAYSLPKANRFANGPKYSGQPTFVVDSSFRANTTKGAGFGFGNKRQFPDWMERNMKENPAPGSYFDHPATAMEFRARGPTFGLPYKYYEKVMIPKEKTVYPRPERKSPERVSNRKI